MEDSALACVVKLCFSGDSDLKRSVQCGRSGVDSLSAVAGLGRGDSQDGVERSGGSGAVPIQRRLFQRGDSGERGSDLLREKQQERDLRAEAGREETEALLQVRWSGVPERLERLLLLRLQLKDLLLPCEQVLGSVGVQPRHWSGWLLLQSQLISH